MLLGYSLRCIVVTTELQLDKTMKGKQNTLCARKLTCSNIGMLHFNLSIFDYRKFGRGFGIIIKDFIIPPVDYEFKILASLGS